MFEHLTLSPTLSPDFHWNEFFAAFFICLLWSVSTGHEHRRGSESSLTVDFTFQVASSLPQQTSRTSTTLQNLYQPGNLPFYSLIAPKKNSEEFLHSSTEASDFNSAANHSAISRSTPLNPVACNINTLNLAVRLKAYRTEYFIIAYIKKSFIILKEEDDYCK